MTCKENSVWTHTHTNTHTYIPIFPTELNIVCFDRGNIKMWVVMVDKIIFCKVNYFDKE